MTTEPSPGVARREGRGFVDSFGQGRTCRIPSCETTLSRYNVMDVCGVHERAGDTRSSS